MEWMDSNGIECKRIGSDTSETKNPNKPSSFFGGLTGNEQSFAKQTTRQTRFHTLVTCQTGKG